MSATVIASTAALAACGKADSADATTRPTPGPDNISAPRGLAKLGQHDADTADDIAQQVAEALVVRDGTTSAQVQAHLTKAGLLAADADVQVDAAGLDDVVSRSFESGRTVRLAEPSKIGRYGELPDTSGSKERSVSLELTGLRTDDLTSDETIRYAATVYVVMAHRQTKWVATGVRVLAFGRA